LKYVGQDDRGVELEVITRPLRGGDDLVIHSMPTNYRHNREEGEDQ
jgi:hypothetical protein